MEPLEHPLHVAVRSGQYEVVQLHISSKCDINAVDRDAFTPVFAAANYLEKDITDLLLRHGAQVNRAHPSGLTLLHLASYNGWADTVQHILSLEEEVDIDATTEDGRTPLMMAAMANSGDCEFEVDIDATAEDGCTPLMMAAMANSGDCTDILLRAGADPNQRDEDKWTALHHAVDNCNTRVVQVLLGVEGLDLNPQDKDGQTPLHLACEYQGILKEMLEAGADYTIFDNNGETALSVGIKKMELTLEDIKLFVQQGLFFQENEYMRIFQNSILKESILKDVSLCTQSVVNKFHRQTLPALKNISYFAEQLPNIDNFKLSAGEVAEVEELVQCEIGRNNFCNVLKVHPMSLKALCILTLITY